MSPHPKLFFGAVLCAVLALQNADSPAHPGKGVDPVKTSHVETTTLTLMLFDVEAADARGNPMRGLKKSDFKVFLDGRPWPIYSVDDLCACDSGPPSRGPISPPGAESPLTHDSPAAGTGPAQAEVSPGEGGGEHAGRPIGAAEEGTRFVVYIDFSQLTLAGRLRVLNEAEKWVKEAPAPSDLVEVEAYATATGLKELCPFTRDRKEVLDSLERVRGSRALIESYAELQESRAVESDGDPKLRQPYAMEEYFHGRRSLRAMKEFLARLDDVPGRKALFFFHENGVMYPGRIYQTNAPSQLGLVGEVAAAANASRTALYPVQVGPLPTNIGQPGEFNYKEELERQVLIMGAALSEFTGGRYNRGPADRSRLMNEAARDCRCLYRIGLLPEEIRPHRVYDVRIVAAGATLPHRYRIQSRTEADRWMRKAQSVLLKPAEARDIDVGAAIVPLSASGKRWDVSLDVSMSTNSLALLPVSAGREGTYEVGALLHRLDGEGSWEMLGEFKVRRGSEGVSDRVSVHRRQIHGLKPGAYRLAAFVRDRTVNVFGGAEAYLHLPPPGEEGVSGPVVMLAGRKQLVSPLPLFNGAEAGPEEAARSDSGPIPAGWEPAVKGDSIQFLTWVCSSPENRAPDGVVRFVSRDDVPIFRFEKAEPERAGSCYRFADILDSSLLHPSSYTYHIGWTPAPAGKLVEASAPFEIGDPEARPE